jgi:hypothetical protein
MTNVETDDPILNEERLRRIETLRPKSGCSVGRQRIFVFP